MLHSDNDSSFLKLKDACDLSCKLDVGSQKTKGTREIDWDEMILDWIEDENMFTSLSMHPIVRNLSIMRVRNCLHDGDGWEQECLGTAEQNYALFMSIST